MRTHCTALSLSDFLESVAATEAANGMDINADVYRQRAAEATRQQRPIEHLREENDVFRTRMAEAQRVMQGV